MLRTKSIHDPISKSDGFRISVMSRHTLGDGKTPDMKIIPYVSYDEHWVELAPLSTLVGKLKRKEIDWVEFTEKYAVHLRQDKPADSLVKLSELALRKDVTILCVEPKGENCHRVILAEKCKEQFPQLEIMHV